MHGCVVHIFHILFLGVLCILSQNLRRFPLSHMLPVAGSGEVVGMYSGLVAVLDTVIIISAVLAA